MRSKIIKFLKDLNYAARPLRFLLLTEALLLWLVFSLPQGREILHISLEDLQVKYASGWLQILIPFAVFLAMVLFLSLTGTLFFRTLLLYRSYKEFDTGFDATRIRRLEQGVIYMALSLPVIFYLLYWAGNRLPSTLGIVLMLVLLQVLLVWRCWTDDQLIARSDPAMNEKTYFQIFLRRSWKELTWLLWSIPGFFLFFPSEIWLAQTFGSIGLLLLASYVIFHIIYLTNWVRIKWRAPSFLLLAVWIFVWSHTNGNHRVETQGGSEDIASRPELRSALTSWIDQRRSSDTVELTIYLVAAEGGGSRAAYWTTGVLNHLNREIPEFRQQLLAISSVSGGTVGAGLFLAGHYQRSNSLFTDLDSALLDAAGHDFLSPLLSGFFFSDLAQQFVPVPILSWDRSRRLEQAITRSIDPVFAGNDHQNPLRLPSMLRGEEEPWHLINSTVVETGGKGIWSPVLLDTVYFPGVKDLAFIIGEDVSRATALVNSARFPIITPGGEMVGRGERTLGHLVDGGYFENTGIESAFSLLRAILDLNDPTLHPVFIYIQNSLSGQDYEPARSTLTASNPVRVFYNAWSSRSPSNHALVEGLEEDLGFRSVHIPLIHEREGEPYPFPLAWVLSQKSKLAMDLQLDTLWRRPELEGLGVVE